ncbi:MAG: NUDIX hydrolase [Pseudomonadota bacterium]
MKRVSSQAKKNPLQPRVAVAAVVVRDSHVLLIQRRHAPNAGLWTFPGGKVGWGESLAQAVAREVLEETQIHIEVVQPLYVFDLIETHNGFHYVIIDYIARWRAGEPRAADDASAVRWFDRAAWLSAEVEPRTRRLLEQSWRHLVTA